jgi:hypothetical protein
MMGILGLAVVKTAITKLLIFYRIFKQCGDTVYKWGHYFTPL